MSRPCAPNLRPVRVPADEKLRQLVSELFANLRLKHLPPHIWSVGPGAGAGHPPFQPRPHALPMRRAQKLRYPGEERTLLTAAANNCGATAAGIQPTLRTIGHVFDEQITQKPPDEPEPIRGPQRKARNWREKHALTTLSIHSRTDDVTASARLTPLPLQGPAAPIVPAPVGGSGYQPALDGDDEEEGRPVSSDDNDDGMDTEPGPRPPPSSAAAGAAAPGSDGDAERTTGPVAGPSLPPGVASASVAANGSADGDDEPPVVRPRRVLGPAAPPAEVLAAAAELAEALVGPPPPDLVEEDDGAAPATRDEAVKVVLKRMQSGANAYKMLGVMDSKAGAGEIKKAYWKLSLLVHPDKCSHPSAGDAFQALAAARDTLSDPAKRAEVDDAVLEEEWRERYHEDLAFRRRAMAPWEAEMGRLCWVDVGVSAEMYHGHGCCVVKGLWCCQN